MLTLISKIVGYVFNHNEPTTPAQPDTTTEPSEIDDPFKDTPFLPISYEDQLKTSMQNGTVTRILQGHGLIDNNFYFSVSDIQGSYTPEVGDSVFFKAVQQNTNAGWRAEDITKNDQSWEAEATKEVKEIDLNILQGSCVLGKVTYVNNGIGKINDDISFELDKCLDGFIPKRGDWVSANVKESEELSTDEWNQSCKKTKQAYNICPTRTKTLDGTISAVRQDHGFINEDIFFDKSSCVNGYWPKRNEVVRVVAIESSQGRTCEWRAISVVPLSSGSQANRSKKYEQTRERNNSWLIPGQRPRSCIPKIQLPVKLPHYTVPTELEQHLIDGDELTTLMPYLSQELSFHNYVRRMSTLLHLEEIQMKLDIRQFDMSRVALHPAGEFLALTVPGLAEGRPSVLIGDKIILSSPSDPDGPRYEGYVHELTCTEVHLKFNPEFHSRYNNEDYNVEFTFRRSQLRRCHQAVSLAVQFLTSKVLFPKEVELKEPLVKLLRKNPQLNTAKTDDSLTSYSNIHFFNPCLNERQKTAVAKILMGQARPLPYVIFGPPGTGKTITVVEAILQVLTMVPSSRIIACTPSNSAADLITERLHLSNAVQQTQMVRLNAFQRSADNIPESILKYCKFGEDLENIARHRVIICTCTMAGTLYALGIRGGHFTHVFVDECGQATEPECLIPMGLVSGAEGQIILAGDPKQLGPIIMSPLAKLYGLELSLLERLMDRAPYLRDNTEAAEHGGFDSALVTMLVNNYRSHPDILALPSRLFYYNQLEPFADPSLTHTLAKWKLLPKSGFPIIFHGIRGTDIRETNSPSWFNPEETIYVVKYLQGVLKEGVKPEDIGIITPYRKQVEKICLMIDRLGIPEVKVGSVEEFQGQERQVIIISTVRSNEKLIGSDVRHTLGFLSNPKRFNVSITRAISLLILVGNPFVLGLDANWRSLIQYCNEKGGYTGCDLPDFSQKPVFKA
ncbi:RNA helicase Mov10l1-like [Physella acuta]|uniref:RNA helicase Mov10l1-like n=1 Tax=Physella acuta TaxID=109671 RepID=UPI0027DACFD8|nr:RNA helicase Mov10l1-like [Physella acuta]